MTSILVQMGEERFNEEGHRLVAGCIPYRREENTNTVKILMVKSKYGQNFVFPKGGWEVNETIEDAALREAQEEAGVQGLVQHELGVWTFDKPKRQLKTNPMGTCVVTMFLLEVTQVLDTWPEQQHRRREWIDLSEINEVTIKQRCRHIWMAEALLEFVRQQRRSFSTAEEASSVALQLRIPKVIRKASEKCHDMDHSLLRNTDEIDVCV